MRKPKGKDQYVKAIEYSHTLEKLLIMEREKSAALRDELEKAERERDELRAEQAEHDEQIARMESKFSLAKRALDSKTARCEKAEAEIRRRDAAAAEPDGYIFCHPSGKNFWSVSHDDTAGHNGVKPFYFAAPPDVLPPEKPVVFGSDLCQDIENYGYNLALADTRQLGAQQQQVVELPMPFDLAINLARACGDIEYQHHESGEHFDRDEIFSALDAANVKWEVKSDY